MIVSKDDFIHNKRVFLSKIVNGAVFIYPTDTIYGIGCDATNAVAVQRVRVIKKRESKPFSVIAPSVEWIEENCVLSNEAKGWLLKLPGPYTLILPLKNAKAVSSVVNQGLNSLGVRIPNHWFSSVVRDFGRPVVTTSVNFAGEVPALHLEEFKGFSVDFVVYDGAAPGRPSRVVDLTGKEKVVRD